MLRGLKIRRPSGGLSAASSRGLLSGRLLSSTVACALLSVIGYLPPAPQS